MGSSLREGVHLNLEVVAHEIELLFADLVRGVYGGSSKDQFCRLCEILLERFEIVAVPSEIQVIELAFRETCVVKDDSRGSSIWFQFKFDN